MEKRAELKLLLKAWRGPPRTIFGWKLYSSHHRLIAESTVTYTSTTRLREAVWSIFGDSVNITVTESPGFPQKRLRKK